MFITDHHHLLLSILSTLMTVTSSAPISTNDDNIVVQPPHCSPTSIITSQLSSQADSDRQSKVDNGRQMRISIALNTTVCFRANNSDDTSPLHTLTLSSIEQHHPIIESYRFAIPLVRTECICECDISSTDKCDPEKYHYAQCNKSALCFRSYYGSQPSTGCRTHEHPSKLCCDIAFEPHNQRKYFAVRIDQPDAYALFTYRSYEWDSSGRWSIESTKTIRMPIDGLTHSGLFLSVSTIYIIV